MYVEELVGAHTVNTMPLQTLLAVADHGAFPDRAHPSAEQDPGPELAALAQAGIDLHQVTDDLLVDGIRQFADALRRLLDGIDERRAAVLTGRPPTIRATLPGEMQGRVAERVRGAVEEKVARRVWCRDATLWGGPGAPETEDRLGWLTVSGTLIAAQAAGDLLTLRAHGLPAERVRLEGTPASAVRALTERIAALLAGA
jgi:transaldolase / glucose-6-phosphate isomerase